MYNESIAIKVKEMAASGISNQDIAYYFKISEQELLTDYEHEIRTSRIDRIVSVSNILYNGILEDGHAASAMFYLKNVGRWEDLGKVEPVNTDKDIRSITVRLPTKEEIEAHIDGGSDES